MITLILVSRITVEINNGLVINHPAGYFRRSLLLFSLSKQKMDKVHVPASTGKARKNSNSLSLQPVASNYESTRQSISISFERKSLQTVI